MRVEDAIRTKLLATAGVTALVNQRVWTLILPQSPTLPAVCVQLIDEQIDDHLRGIQEIDKARVQIDVYAGKNSSDPNGTAHDVMDAVMAALTPEPFSVAGVGSPAIGRDVLHVHPEGRQPSFIAEEKLQVRIQQDFMVTSRPT